MCSQSGLGGGRDSDGVFAVFLAWFRQIRDSDSVWLLGGVRDSDMYVFSFWVELGIVTVYSLCSLCSQPGLGRVRDSDGVFVFAVLSAWSGWS